MKVKNINRRRLIEFLLSKTNTIKSCQQQFTGRNIYFLMGKDEDDGCEIEMFQVEFLSSKNYLFTIIIRGMYREATFLHEDTVNYIRQLNLGREICVDTEYKQTII